MYKHFVSRSTLIALALGLLADTACSSSDEDSSGTGGAGFGGVSTTGGAVATGRATGGGLAPTTGGVVAGSGGWTATGGEEAKTGGAAGIGGTENTGGTATGGIENTGGMATGGIENTGGTGTGGIENTGGISGNGLLLPQEGNPATEKFDRYKEFTDRADNILSHQFDNGGWPKNVSYGSPGDGGDDLGTFDNGATTMELTVMADAYKRTGDSKYLESARRGIDFVLDAQYPEGGWPQFYPLRGGYSDHVTFNDDAMSRVLTLLHHAAVRTPPFDTDVFTEEQRARIQPAIDGGVDFILKAQIIQNGVKAVWCAQHGKSDYEPKGARAYEHPSLSGSESIEIIGFLMTQPQTPEVKEAVIAAVNWYRSPDTILEDYAYENDEFIPREGSRVWYRFYDIPTNEPIFSNYDGKIHLGLENQDKKKDGYRWGGIWGERIIGYAESVGY